MDAHRPLMILFENVDAMDEAGRDGGNSPLDVFLGEMSHRGVLGEK